MQHAETKPQWIESIVNGISKGVSLLIVLIMFFTSWEVVSRYLFNHPTTWVWLINKQLFGIFILMAGPYTLVQRSHIRIEMLYDRFSPGFKRIVGYISFVGMLLFLGALVWKGAVMGHDAWVVKERAVGVFPLPLYPLKLLIPVFGVFFLLAGIQVFLGSRR